MVSGIDSIPTNYGLRAKAINALWGLKFLCKHGRPKQKVYRFGGGLGDHLITSSVFRESMKRGIGNCWMLSNFPDVFEKNPDVHTVAPDNWRVIKLCSKMGHQPITLFYGNWIGDNDKITPPKAHIIVELLKHAGISGEVAVMPYYHGVNKQTPEQHLRSRQVCIQGANTASSTPMRNKQWLAERFNILGEKLSDDYDLVQIGLPGESDISHAQDMRGKLSIKETARLLANSRFFIGQVGFLMHLARAVNTRSVIIYGGREKSWQSGYPCNENIETGPPCSPCWQNNHCDFDRVCLNEISVQNVVDAIDRLESRLGEPLETEIAIIQE